VTTDNPTREEERGDNRQPNYRGRAWWQQTTQL